MTTAIEIIQASLTIILFIIVWVRGFTSKQSQEIQENAKQQARNIIDNATKISLAVEKTTDILNTHIKDDIQVQSALLTKVNMLLEGYKKDGND
jgi:hypothetical protein